MPRWDPDAKERLVRAAEHQFTTRGYAATTVAEIAEHAGLTRRSYFRYFTDKAEVAFAGSARLRDVWLEAIDRHPAPVAPLPPVLAALAATTDMFAGRHSSQSGRRALIDATPELQERERLKLARLADDASARLVERGADPIRAQLAAELGTTMMRLALERWARGSGRRPLSSVMAEQTDALHDLTTERS